MKLLKVLRVVTLASRTGKYGGPFDTALRQAVLVTDHGMRVRLLAGSLAGDRPELVAFGVDAVLPTVRRWLPTRGFTGVFSFSFLRAAMREIHRADVVHLSVSRELVSLAVIFLTVVQRKRLICQPHGMLTSRGSRLHTAFDAPFRLLVRRAESIVALTAVERRLIGRWLKSPDLSSIEVIGNPVLDANLYAGSPRTRTSKDEGEVIMIGRLHSRKRTDVFVEAARMARDRGLPWRFTLIGPDEGELDRMLESIDSLPNLVYEGVLRGDQVAARLQQADVFALCSSAEPWGNVLVQAIVEGIPVVVPESAHLAGMILDYGAGIVVPDACPEAICVGVDALLMNSDRYRECSAQAIQLADAKFSDAAVGSALIHLYSSSRGNRHSVDRDARRA